MGIWSYSVAAFVGALALWAMGGTEREKLVVAGGWVEPLRALEASVAADGRDAAHARSLAQAYLDAHHSGLALALIEAAPPGVQSDLRLRHIYARALLDQGRNEKALVVESGVVDACRPRTDGSLPTSCDPVLLASAVRRTAILQELVALGIHDTLAHPEASLVAYRNATRQARVSLQ
jgi:hypothetical protein